uniref:SHSP domain-containing protein n=1 Tax=Oryza meridionalis TaxID=40149 RepID=A0A0E0E821_9ORYZ
MRVHPAPRKRAIAVQRRCGVAAAAAGMAGGKKLRRLPHIFAKVLELPFAADADVSVEEDAAALRFVAAADGFTPSGGASAHAVEIHPGVTKVVVRDLSAGVDGDDGAAAFELDRWRFRLPPCTLPAMATATYADGELVVTVPKGAAPDDDGDGAAAAVLGGPGVVESVLLLDVM